MTGQHFLVSILKWCVEIPTKNLLTFHERAWLGISEGSSARRGRKYRLPGAAAMIGWIPCQLIVECKVKH